MWWDDYMACIPLLADCLHVIIIWLRNRNGLAAALEFERLFFYSNGFTTILFFTVIWTSRISTALSIARIFPAGSRCRRVALGLVILFLLFYLASFLIGILTCRQSSSAWYQLHLRSCLGVKRGSLLTAPFYIAAEILGDVVLIVTPLVMLWKVKLPTKQRRLILGLFTTSILTTISAIPFAASWYFVNGCKKRCVLIAMTPLLQELRCSFAISLL
ncbi:hypothetical protein B0H34DRAFT_378340 [Crassisporium funariophilum]|nr:hypothetical protein B0H34DRAFT_378340 [Crassisporium funariophilum]